MSMDTAYFRELSRLILAKQDSYCITSRENDILVCTKPSQTYLSIEEVPQDTFVTGWQKHDGLFGHWQSWKNVETVQRKDEYTFTETTLPESEQTIDWAQTHSKEGFIRSIDSMIEDMKRGEYYLSNLTRSISTTEGLDAQYLALASCLHHYCSNRFFHYSKQHCVLGLSPENFLKINNETVECEPMKGTGLAGSNLLNDAKEIEENSMIIDLVRSDLSKICLPESIKVDSRNSISSHPGLIQMSSKVIGTLDEGISIQEAILKMMPIASVTGTPKPYVVKKILQYERNSRDIYCGTYGWVDTTARKVNLCVAIRTIDFNSQITTIGSGAGITVKSVPEKEFQETELKLSRLVKLCDRSTANVSNSVFTSLAMGESGKFYELDLHCGRVALHAKSIGINIDPDFVSSQVREFMSSQEIKEGQYLKVKINSKTSLDIELKTYDLDSSHLTLGIAFVPQNANETLNIKSLDRTVYENALQDGQACSLAKIDDTLLLNVLGITETQRANVFIRKGNVITTSPDNGNLLAGILRHKILETRPQGFDYIENNIAIQDLLECDEVITTNSVRGPLMVGRIINEPLEIDYKYHNTNSLMLEHFNKIFIDGFHS